MVLGANQMYNMKKRASRGDPICCANGELCAQYSKSSYSDQVMPADLSLGNSPFYEDDSSNKDKELVIPISNENDTEVMSKIRDE